MAGRVRELSVEECHDLLQHHGFVGRLAFVVDGKPQIVPVNYLANEASVTFCTQPGTKLSAVAAGAEVAFEVDESRPMRHSGWSVVVTGTAREVTDPEELTALRHGPLKSWAADPSARWVRIAIDSISGRAIEDD
ncbi:MAG TPA: pyridoxamine 5'-phosphate oxidase family protein [Candidatus Dormibacteraeota bacterium]